MLKSSAAGAHRLLAATRSLSLRAPARADTDNRFGGSVSHAAETATWHCDGGRRAYGKAYKPFWACVHWALCLPEALICKDSQCPLGVLSLTVRVGWAHNVCRNRQW